MVSIYIIRPTICYQDGDIYIGSTKLKLNKRFTNHNTDYNSNNNSCTSKILFEKFSREFLEIIEIEKCNENDRLHREKFWIQKLKCVNKVIPLQTQKEYNIKNKEKRTDYNKKYREKNKEKISKQKNEKIYCECGGKYGRSSKTNHLNTIKHQAWL